MTEERYFAEADSETHEIDRRMVRVTIVVDDFKDYKDVVRLRWVSKKDSDVFDKEILMEKGKPFHIEFVD